MSKRTAMATKEEQKILDRMVDGSYKTNTGKLDKPARIGNAVFGKGVDERLVIECAQRAYAYDWEEKVLKGLICEHEKVRDTCTECGAIAY